MRWIVSLNALLIVVVAAWAGTAWLRRGELANQSLRPSPKSAMQSLLQAHRARDYAAVSDHVIAGKGADVTTLLLAVDDFRSANERLAQLVRDKISLGASQLVDQSAWVSRLDVFSRYVDLLDERITGDTAFVTFTIDRQLPPNVARLEWDGRRWRYDPGQGDAAALADAFRQMARGLDACRGDLEAGRIDAAAAREDPQILIDEIMTRIRAGVRKLPRPTAESP
jgi:hypothetical protein